jgi:anaphase-promoting complex subunit 4
MSSSVEGLDQQCASGTLLESTTDPNFNSYLSVADDQGHLYYFLDGSYPLGPVSFGSGSELSLASLCLVQSRPLFLCHPRIQDEAYGGTDLHPTVIHLPLLEKRTARDLAKLCSTARELVWYTTRVIKEMRAVWFGSNTSSGARELGPKWTRALEARQKEKFGRKYFFS